MLPLTLSSSGWTNAALASSPYILFSTPVDRGRPWLDSPHHVSVCVGSLKLHVVLQQHSHKSRSEGETPSLNLVNTLAHTAQRAVGHLCGKMLNGINPTVPPWGEPLVTSCQMDFIPPVITLRAQPFSQFSTCFIVHCLSDPTIRIL